MNTAAHKLEFPLIRHQDFATIPESEGSVVAECGDCGHIFRSNALVDEETFRGADYAKSAQAGQKLGGGNTRCALQALLLYGSVPGARSVLDVGCFTGELLSEIAVLAPGIRRVGFDVNPHLEAYVKQTGAEFICGDFAKVEGTFDLVAISHALMYMPSFPDFVSNVSNLLDSNGLLFVQVPDLCCKPYSLLLGDQYSYFTSRSLVSVFSHHGFSLSLCGTDIFPREIAAIGRMQATAPELVTPALPQVVVDLNATRDILLSLEVGEPLGVLGTTVNAAFVHDVLKSRITFFCDENPGKTLFRGLPVLHPSHLCSKATLIVPFGQDAADLAKRIESSYGVSCIAV